MWRRPTSLPRPRYTHDRRCWSSTTSTRAEPGWIKHWSMRGTMGCDQKYIATEAWWMRQIGRNASWVPSRIASWTSAWTYSTCKHAMPHRGWSYQATQRQEGLSRAWRPHPPMAILTRVFSLKGGQCQGPSHGGTYVDEGTSDIRIKLLPIVVPGDCLVSPPILCLPHWSLTYVQCQMIQGCTSMLPPLFPFCVRAPGGYVSWSLIHPLALLRLGSRPVQTIYLPVMAMVQGVSQCISHGQSHQSVVVSHVW